MNRLICLFGALAVVCMSMFSAPATAADFTFQIINDTERALNLKLFSRSDSHQQWPSKTKAFSIRPNGDSVQQLKISCEEGEQICWGAWMTVESVSGEVGPGGKRATRISNYQGGVGERGQRTCERCCHVCKQDALTPVMKLREGSTSSPAAK